MASYYDSVTVHNSTNSAAQEPEFKRALRGTSTPSTSGWRPLSYSEYPTKEFLPAYEEGPRVRDFEPEFIDPKQSLDITLRESISSLDEKAQHTPCSPKQDRRLPPLRIPVPASASISPPELPRDTGRAAWIVLVSATIVSSLICGVYLSFGVFQQYYTTKPGLGGGALSAMIGVLSSGLTYMGAPLMTYLCERFRLSRIHYVWIGWLMCIVALVGAAFSTNVNSLIVTQGLLYGIGVLMCDNPILIIVNTWFIKRRGTAYGILFGMCDLMGVGWSFLANYLLRHHGLRVTFLVFAGVLFLVAGPFILLLKERGATNVFRHRTPITQNKIEAEDASFPAVGGNFELIRRDTPETRKRYFVRPIFYVFLVSNLAQAVAFYLPLIYLPSCVTDLGYNSDKGAAVLAIANVAQIVGEIGFGRASDKINVHILIVLSSTTAALSSFLLWGLSTNFSMLAAFAFMFGMSGAGFLALWARMGTLFGERDAQMVYSFMCTGRGLGTIISGPVSGILIRGVASPSMYGLGKYRWLVAFVGTSMAVSAALGFLGIFTALGNMKNWLQRRHSVTSPSSARM